MVGREDDDYEVLFGTEPARDVIQADTAHCSVTRVVYLQRANLFVTACVDRAVRVYRASEPGEGALHVLRGPHNAAVRDVASLEDNDDYEGLIASVAGDGSLCTWDAKRGTLVDSLELENHEWTAVVRLNGDTMVTGDEQGQLCLMRHTEGKRVSHVLIQDAHRGRRVNSICAYSVGRSSFIVSGGDDSLCVVWDDKLVYLEEFDLKAQVSGVACTRDHIAACCADGSVHVINAYSSTSFEHRWCMLDVDLVLNSVCFLDSDVLMVAGVSGAVTFVSLPEAATIVRVAIGDGAYLLDACGLTDGYVVVAGLSSFCGVFATPEAVTNVMHQSTGRVVKPRRALRASRRTTTNEDAVPPASAVAPNGSRIRRRDSIDWDSSAISPPRSPAEVTKPPPASTPPRNRHHRTTRISRAVSTQESPISRQVSIDDIVVTPELPQNSNTSPNPTVNQHQNSSRSPSLSHDNATEKPVQPKQKHRVAFNLGSPPPSDKPNRSTRLKSSLRNTAKQQPPLPAVTAKQQLPFNHPPESPTPPPSPLELQPKPEPAPASSIAHAKQRLPFQHAPPSPTSTSPASTSPPPPIQAHEDRVHVEPVVYKQTKQEQPPKYATSVLSEPIKLPAANEATMNGVPKRDIEKTASSPAPRISVAAAVAAAENNGAKETKRNSFQAKRNLTVDTKPVVRMPLPSRAHVTVPNIFSPRTDEEDQTEFPEMDSESLGKLSESEAFDDMEESDSAPSTSDLNRRVMAPSQSMRNAAMARDEAAAERMPSVRDVAAIWGERIDSVGSEIRRLPTPKPGDAAVVAAATGATKLQHVEHRLSRERERELPHEDTDSSPTGSDDFVDAAGSFSDFSEAYLKHGGALSEHGTLVEDPASPKEDMVMAEEPHVSSMPSLRLAEHKSAVNSILNSDLCVSDKKDRLKTTDKKDRQRTKPHKSGWDRAKATTSGLVRAKSRKGVGPVRSRSAMHETKRDPDGEPARSRTGLARARSNRNGIGRTGSAGGLVRAVSRRRGIKKSSTPPAEPDSAVDQQPNQFRSMFDMWANRSRT